MRKLILILFFIQGSLYAQSVKLTWSPELEKKRKIFINDIIYSDSSGIYYTTIEYGRKGGFNTIEKLSANFAPVFSKELAAFEDGYTVREIDFAKKHFLIFLNKHEKKSDGSKYYVAKMDMKGNVNGTAKEYLSVNEATFAKSANINIIPSYDSTKFLILATRGVSSYGFGALREYNKYKKEEEKFIITVLNNDGTKAWQKTVSIANKEERAVRVLEYAVTPNGDVYFLISECLSEKCKSTIKDANGNKKPGYKYRLMKFSNGGKDTKDFPVDLGNLYVNSIDIKINTKNNNLVCTGFYNDQDNEVLKGLFYFEVDNTGAVVKKNNKDFPQDFVEEFKKHKETKKDKKNNDDDDLGLSKNFTIDRIYAREDGGAYLLAEYFTSKTVCTTTSSGGTTCKTYYYHNDILTVNIGADGMIDWFYRIPKKQTEVNIIKYASYISTLYKDNLYIIFNDNPKNMDNEEDEKSTNTVRFKKSVCALEKIDKNKNVTKQELFKNEEIEKILCPFKSRVLAENIIILYADKYKDNDPKLGKIVIE